MRKLIVSTYVTLDGVIQPLDWFGEGASPVAQRERDLYARELLLGADALILGRETYQIFAEFWPTQTVVEGDPEGTAFNDRINSMPKYVASTTLTEPLTWNATKLGADLPAHVRQLKEEGNGSFIMYGCGKLARTLHEHGLVDEFLFWVYPVVRGKGTRLFWDELAADFEVAESRQFQSGFTVLTCRPRSTQ